MNCRVLFALLAWLPGALLVAADSTVEADPFDSPIKAVKPSTPQQMATRFFEDALAPHGQWVEVSGYGRCWKPKVGPGWMPYTQGHWGYTEAGWTWVSDEDFGSVVFHYGRWLRTSTDGWCWVPGLDWAGAWVSWRYGTEHIGWAPLPPAAVWNPEVGIAPWADREYSIGPNHYRFCVIGEAGDPKLSQRLLPVGENPDRIRRTVNTTNLSAFNQGVFCGGPAYDWVSARSRGSFHFMQLVKERSLTQYGLRLKQAGEASVRFKGLSNAQQIYVIAPDWRVLTEPRKAQSLGFRTDDSVEALKASGKWREGETLEREVLIAQEEALVRKAAAEAKRKAAGEAFVLNGWEGIPDDGSRTSLRSKVSREVNGLTPANTAARRVDPEVDFPRRTSAAIR